MELAVRDDGVFGDLLAGAAHDQLATHVSAIHTYPVREIYMIIAAGRPTDVGLRSFPAVQVIITAGAEDQRSEAVLNLVFGDFVCGLDQLR